MNSDNSFNPEITEGRLATGTEPVSQIVTDTVTSPSLHPDSTESVLYIEYNLADWEELFDQDMVVKILASSTQQVWLLLDQGTIALSQEGTWIMYSDEDTGLSSGPHDIVLSPDGTLWVATLDMISRFQKGAWEVFSIPDPSEFGYQRLALDSSGNVWVAPHLGGNIGVIKRFDGNSWKEFSIPYSASMLEFTKRISFGHRLVGLQELENSMVRIGWFFLEEVFGQ